MSLSPAERIGLAGAILLGSALVAAAILAIGKRQADVAPRENGKADRPAVGTAEPDPPPKIPTGRGGRVPDLKREIRRLRAEIVRRDEKIAALSRRLEAEGLTAEETPPDATALAAAAVEGLTECGPETSPADIEAFLREIIRQGAAGVPPVKKFLARGIDTTWSDTWNFYGGRFTAYPSLRIALIDALRQIGAGEGAAAVDGQAAMVTLLRKSEDPLEICLLVTALAGIQGVDVVEGAVLAGAHRFLTLPPHPRERYLMAPLVNVLASQEPSDAARDLLTYYLSDKRPAAQAAVVLPLIARLPEEAALPALEKAVGAGEGNDKSVRAARLIARARGEPAHAAARRVLGSAGPEVRAAVYETIPRVPGEEIASLERTALREGLEALASLDRFDAELQAREKILEERAEVEEHPARKREIEKARRRLSEFAERGGKLRRRLRGG